MYYKRNLLLTFVFFAFTCGVNAKIYHLLPKPKMVEKDTETLLLNKPLRFTSQPSLRISHAFTNFLHVTFNNQASSIPVTVECVDSIKGSYDYLLDGYPNETYCLRVNKSGIKIQAITEVGVLRAIQTLAQMMEGNDIPSLECCTITDWPSFKIRGLMHDVGRSFISTETLKKQIRLLARFKVNTFHLHLTENQAWRFEVKQYPQLTDSSSMTRFVGKFYSQKECRELDELAYDYGITLIPEIDMPGHSAAFERAMRHSMQTDQGMTELKNILTEVASVFVHAPYIHIGADEQTINYPQFLETICNHVHSLGKKVVIWNPIRGVQITPNMGADMTQMWSTAGKMVKGMPNIDCRYNYINHFDLFADVVGIYRSNIYNAQRGDSNIAGTISAVWNDRFIEDEDGIMRQNNVYANVLASAERAWMGGGKQYIEQGGTILPLSGDEYGEFRDWERRFLFHKAHSLSTEPISYVQQSQVCWQITDAFPNHGNPSEVFPPETEGMKDSYVYQGQSYKTGLARGAGIYLRHVWGTVVPGFYARPQLNTTAYAWTYVYSPIKQRAGALIEFQNYSRSEKDTAPPMGCWDGKGSRLWLNDVEIAPPHWSHADVPVSHETPLKNENVSARTPVPIVLEQGWNKVFLKIPYIHVPFVRLNKWMFTFVITDLDGRNALNGLVYSPQKTFQSSSDNN